MERAYLAGAPSQVRSSSPAGSSRYSQQQRELGSWGFLATSAAGVHRRVRTQAE
jgi:hypothetical protein